jgi:hypothetical protein
MTTGRPNPCPGRGLEQCSRCLRFNERPMPFQTVVQPELVDGRCTDYLEAERIASSSASARS